MQVGFRFDLMMGAGGAHLGVLLHLGESLLDLPRIQKLLGELGPVWHRLL